MKTTRSATWARGLAAAPAERTAAPPRRGLGSGRAGSTRSPGGSAGGSLGWISQPQTWLQKPAPESRPFLTPQLAPLLSVRLKTTSTAQNSRVRRAMPPMVEETISTDKLRARIASAPPAAIV